MTFTIDQVEFSKTEQYSGNLQYHLTHSGREYIVIRKVGLPLPIHMLLTVKNLKEVAEISEQMDRNRNCFNKHPNMLWINKAYSPIIAKQEVGVKEDQKKMTCCFRKFTA